MTLKLPALVAAAVAAPVAPVDSRPHLHRPLLRWMACAAWVGMENAEDCCRRTRLSWWPRQWPDAQTVKFDYTLTPDTYLYRDKLAYVVKSPADVKVASVDTPAGDVKDDPSFGRTEVYHKDFTASVTLSRALAAGEKLVLEATWQGCNEAVGICYPPISRDFTLARRARSAVSAAAVSSAPPTAAGPANESDTSKIERVLKGGSFWARRRHFLRPRPAAGADARACFR